MTCPHCGSNDVREITRFGDDFYRYRCDTCRTIWTEAADEAG
jgi:transposase-like protein